MPSCSQMRLQLLHFHALSVTKVKMSLAKYEDYEEIFFLASNVGVVVLICLSSLILRSAQRLLVTHPSTNPARPDLTSLSSLFLPPSDFVLLLFCLYCHFASYCKYF